MANLTVNGNFTGDHAGKYIAAALKEATSLEYMTVMENIKYKRNITKMTGQLGSEKEDGLIGDRTCDFTSRSKLTLTDKVLEPKALQVNYEVCKGDLIKDWQALQMKAGQWNTNMGADFQSFLISQVAGVIAQGTENSIWGGADATAGQFEGFMTATTGLFTTPDAVTLAPAITGGAYAQATIISDLSALVATAPAAVYSHISDDLYLYMGVKAYRMYIAAISELGYVNAYNMNSTYEPYFEGIKVAVCAGMPDDNACIAQKSNLYFGTDLLSDETEIRILDMSTIDGSDNVRVVAKYTGGVQFGIESDIVWQK